MRRNRGFIALLTVLLVAGIALAEVVGSGIAVFLASSDALGEQGYRQSRAAVLSCAQLAFHAISQDQHRFESGLPIEFNIVGSSTCRISSAVVTEHDADMQIQGLAGHSISSVHAVGEKNDEESSYHITLLKED
jgi:hypothetical protein